MTATQDTHSETRCHNCGYIIIKDRWGIWKRRTGKILCGITGERHIPKQDEPTND